MVRVRLLIAHRSTQVHSNRTKSASVPGWSCPSGPKLTLGRQTGTGKDCNFISSGPRPSARYTQVGLSADLAPLLLRHRPRELGTCAQVKALGLPSERLRNSPRRLLAEARHPGIAAGLHQANRYRERLPESGAFGTGHCSDPRVMDTLETSIPAIGKEFHGTWVRSLMLDPIASFSNSYARLPEHFFARLDPTPVARPRLIMLNRPLAEQLGLNITAVDLDTLAAILGGNLIPAGAEPISMVYAGHQFGNFVPQLGDGRAILLGEMFDHAGVRRDIQLKGAGRTPFSRRGDGRAALGPVLREYLLSEAMHALGIPATRALAAVATGEPVYRESRLPGAILTRVAASHVRVGTFQYFAARGDNNSVRQLADYVVDRHYPGAKDAERPYLALLQAVAERQASLVARWMLAGFIHGVMNTDNMAISGETIDFGPCAFIEAYDPAAVFSAIDEFGRYAFGNQPQVAQWNIARFAEALLPVIDSDPNRATELALEVIAAFPAWFERDWIAGMRSKLGLTIPQDGDLDIVKGLLDVMHANEADFTLTFRRLCDAAGNSENDAGPRALFADPYAYDRWAATWQYRLAREPRSPEERSQAMRRANPAFIPRNHRVEQALDAAVEREDFAPFSELLLVLSRPYEEQDAYLEYALPAQADERVFRTFCGT